MQDFPLTITMVLRHGTRWHADRKVITATDDGYREASYGTVGERVAQLAHGMRGLGITGDERVATFMWNNQEHLEAYLAAPCMGAVLHTLNIRLFPEQLTYVVNHAHDRVVIVTDEQAFASPVDAGRIPVPIYTFNVAGYRAGHLPAGQHGRYTFGGLTDAAFAMLPALEGLRDGGWPF